MRNEPEDLGPSEAECEAAPTYLETLAQLIDNVSSRLANHRTHAKSVEMSLCRWLAQLKKAPELNEGLIEQVSKRLISHKKHAKAIKRSLGLWLAELKEKRREELAQDAGHGLEHDAPLIVGEKS